jgi:hypothetical protein
MLSLAELTESDGAALLSSSVRTTRVYGEEKREGVLRPSWATVGFAGQPCVYFFIFFLLQQVNSPLSCFKNHLISPPARRLEKRFFSNTAGEREKSEVEDKQGI